MNLARRPLRPNPDIPKQRPFSFIHLVILCVIFGSSASCLWLVYSNFPAISANDLEHFKVPKNVEDAKRLGMLISKYMEDNYTKVTVAYFMTYIFLQAFAIPGSIFLSVLSGFLYPFYIALSVVCVCSGIGALLCYLISYFLLRNILQHLLKDRLSAWSSHVRVNKEDMLNYMIVLRVTPILPNWFINLASPLVGVEIWPFFLGTVLGVAPPSFIAIQAGTTLQKLSSMTEFYWSWRNLLIIVSSAFAALLPIIVRKCLSARHPTAASPLSPSNCVERKQNGTAAHH